MASITATVEPTTVIEARDTASETYGHIAVIEFDGVKILLGGTNPATVDAEIIASAGLLIDALGKLRHAAAGRIATADLAAIDAESPAEGHEVVAEWTRATA